MSEKVNVVFHGFLNLTNPEKLLIVEAINEYFDSNNKDRFELRTSRISKMSISHRPQCTVHAAGDERVV